MATQQRRLLTAANSKLGKLDIVKILDKDDAWILLPPETRTQLYSLLPEPEEGQPPHDPDVHPLRTRYKTYIQNELRRWQNDLVEGREVKKWREEAMKAGRDRIQGKFDEWTELQREVDWGKSENVAENLPPPPEDGAPTELSEKEASQQVNSRFFDNDLHSEPGDAAPDLPVPPETTSRDESKGAFGGEEARSQSPDTKSRSGVDPTADEVVEANLSNCESKTELGENPA